MKKLLSLILALIMVLSLVACGGSSDETTTDDTATEESALKVAMLLTGDINDAGWCQSAYEGLVQAQADYGVEIAYTENLVQVDFESSAREYAASGYNLILAVGNEFGDVCATVGAEFPDVKFACFNGNTAVEPNVASYRYTTTETGFLAGVVAATFSESGVVGYIVGASNANIQDSLNAFDDGVAFVDPSYTALQVNIDSMTDVALAKESAEAMIDQGADVVLGNANTAGLGVIQAADEAGIKCLGMVSDQYEVAPNAVVTSIVQDNATMVLAIVKAVVEGTFEPTVNLFGVKDGAIYISDWHGNDANLSEEQMAKIDEAIAGITDGSLKEAGILPKTSFE